jgi:hypothetical protein
MDPYARNAVLASLIFKTGTKYYHVRERVVTIQELLCSSTPVDINQRSSVNGAKSRWYTARGQVCSAPPADMKSQ